jgi:hypothetical protein
LVGLGIGHDARAGGKKVDWSEYLEPSGYRTPAKAPVSQEPVAAATQKQKKTSPSKLRPESRSKPKQTARSKRRR